MKMTEPYDEQEKCNAYDPAQKAEKAPRKERRSRKWDIKGKQGYALYEWWLRKVGEVKGGYGANFLVCMAIYACKCDVPREKLEQDLRGMCENLSTLEYNRRLTEADIQRALETYDKGNYRCTIADIEKLSGIHIERSKRNGRTRAEHLEEARAIRDIRMKRQGRNWWDGGGRPSAEAVIREFMQQHPDARKIDVIKGTGKSAKTVYKYYDRIKEGQTVTKMHAEDKVREYMKTHPTARKVDVIRGTGLSKQTVYKYYDALRQELWPETGMNGWEN